MARKNTRRTSLALWKYDDNFITLKKGEAIFKEGEMGTALFVIRAGTVELQVCGRAVESLPNFASELDRAGVDEMAELTVIRDGQERRVKVKVVDLAK